MVRREKLGKQEKERKYLKREKKSENKGIKLERNKVLGERENREKGINWGEITERKRSNIRGGRV